MEETRTFSTFVGNRRLVGGPLETMLRATKAYVDGAGEQDGAAQVLIFEDRTGAQIDFDLRGTIEEVLARLPEHPLFAVPEGADTRRTGPGRPRLGVVSREVSLLPRHWEWLERQPNGISAALRRLVDEARQRSPHLEEARLLREAASRFMTLMAGDLPGYEEASRALFAKNAPRFTELTVGWPVDVRDQLVRLVDESARLEAGGAAAAAPRS